MPTALISPRTSVVVRRIPRLKSHHLEPTSAPIPRTTAREFLLRYLAEVGIGNPEEKVREYFDEPAADQADEAESAFENAVITIDLSGADERIKDLERLLLACEPEERGFVKQDLAHARRELREQQRELRVAEATRARQLNFRRLLIRAADLIARDAEKRLTIGY